MSRIRTSPMLLDDPSLLVVQFAPFEDYGTKVEEVLKEEGVGMLVRPEESEDLVSFMRARDVIYYGKNENP